MEVKWEKPLKNFQLYKSFGERDYEFKAEKFGAKIVERFYSRNGREEKSGLESFPSIASFHPAEHFNKAFFPPKIFSWITKPPLSIFVSRCFKILYGDGSFFRVQHSHLE